MQGDSSALALVRNVWNGFGEAARIPRRDFTYSMSKALDLAIRAGLRFDRDDFRKMRDQFRSWDCTSESFYSMACATRHVGACQSFEACKGRPPYILGGERLHLDSVIDWEGLHRYAKVTSFAADGQSLIACVYEPKSESVRAMYAIAGKPYGSTKVERRVNITIGEVRRAERANRASNRIKCHQAKVQHACQMVGIDVSREAIDSLTEEQRVEALAWLHDGRWRRAAMPKFLNNADRNLTGT